MVTVTIPKEMRPFECYVNGKKYCYPAGETLDVPEEVAEIINSMSYDNSSLPEQENKTPFEVPEAPPSDGVIHWDDLEGRPFGKETEKVVIFENDSLLGGPALRPDNTTLLVSEMVAGDTYIVTVDGVDYTGVAEWCEDTSSEGNNGILLFSKGEYPTDYSDAPIDIGSYSNHIYVSFEDGDHVRHSVKITHVATIITPIPDEYLPERLQFGEKVEEHEELVILDYAGSISGIIKNH